MKSVTNSEHTTLFLKYSCYKPDCSAHPRHSARWSRQAAERVVRWLWNKRETAEHGVKRLEPLIPGALPQTDEMFQIQTFVHLINAVK